MHSLSVGFCVARAVHVGHEQPIAVSIPFRDAVVDSERHTIAGCISQRHCYSDGEPRKLGNTFTGGDGFHDIIEHLERCRDAHAEPHSVPQSGAYAQRDANGDSDVVALTTVYKQCDLHINARVYSLWLWHSHGDLVADVFG